MDIRVGNGYDVHLLAPGLEFWLGGIRIEHTKGCVAHSDGDTLIHALCDAMLGALALGDIGKHFPDNSAEFKGIDSPEAKAAYKAWMRNDREKNPRKDDELRKKYNLISRGVPTNDEAPDNRTIVSNAIAVALGKTTIVNG